jgi:hypothetical protein
MKIYSKIYCQVLKKMVHKEIVNTVVWKGEISGGYWKSFSRMHQVEKSYRHAKMWH